MKTATDVGAAPEEASRVKAAAGRNPKERLRHLTSRKTALQEEIEAARAVEARRIEALEARRQGLAGGEGTAADVARARRDVEESRATIADLETALAGISERRQALATEIGEAEHEKERRRQEKAAVPLRAQADAAVADFVEAVATVTEHLCRRQEIGTRMWKEFPLAGALPRIGLEDLSKRLRERMGQPGDDLLAYRNLIIRGVAGPTGVPWLPALAPPADRLRALGIEP